MGYFVIFVAATLVIELLFVMMSYDDYFDNIGWSIFWGLVLTISILAISEMPEGFTCKPKPKPQTEQEQQLQAHEDWGTDVIDDVLDITEPQTIDDKIDNLAELIESDEFEDALAVTERSVPSTSSYIDNSRRNYDVKVTYNNESREACDSAGECFTARTVQHTDGTYWACKRNYGTCYEY